MKTFYRVRALFASAFLLMTAAVTQADNGTVVTFNGGSNIADAVVSSGGSITFSGEGVSTSAQGTPVSWKNFTGLQFSDNRSAVTVTSQGGGSGDDPSSTTTISIVLPAPTYPDPVLLSDDNPTPPPVTTYDLSEATISATTSYPYTGQVVDLDYVVKYNGQTLHEGTDYTVGNTNFKNAGTYTLTVTGKGSYTGSKSATIKITRVKLTVHANDTTIAYGEALPELTCTITGFVNGEDTTVLTKQPVLTTDATATSPLGDYQINVEDADAANYLFDYRFGTLTIKPCPVTAAMLTLPDTTFVYNGQPVLPAYTVQRDTVTLTEGTDYIATIADNTNAGTAKLTIEGKGNYTASLDTTFVINKAMLTLKADTLTKVYGEENTELTFELTGFVNDEDTTALTKQPVIMTEATAESAVGDYAITINGGEANNYDFTYVDATLTITPYALTDDMLTLASDSVAYTGQPVMPVYQVLRDSVALTEDTDYTVTVTDHTQVGVATLTIEGTGNYVGQIDTTFVIYMKPSVEMAVNDSIVEPELDEKNKAVYQTDYAQIVISDYYAQPGTIVTLVVEPEAGWLLSGDSIKYSSPIDKVLVSTPTSYIANYTVPEEGLISINIHFIVDSVYVGVRDRKADDLRFEVIDRQTVRISGTEETTPVSVYDARGQLVDSEVMRYYGEILVRLSRQPQGLYMIKVNNTTFKVYRK